MRFGMSGAFLPSNLDDFSEETCRQIKELRFSGCFTRFTNDLFETPLSKAHRVRDLLADHGLRMYQAIGYRPPLHHPDESIRQQAVKILTAAIRLNAALGARETHTGPGSLNPKGAWFPHPYNWTQQARDQLIKSLREVAPVAEDHDIYVGLEGHVLVTLESAEVTAEILRAVGSPKVGCSLDVVNWMTRETVFETGPAIRRMAAALEGMIVAAHSKDVLIEDRLVLHLSECPTGLGILDHDTLLTVLEGIDPELPLVVEHCTAEELPRISRFLHMKAEELGIRVLE